MESFPYPLATPQHRLGGKAVDIAMHIVTFGIGWLIWSSVAWGQGQTPGKQILKMRVYSTNSGRPASWGRMFFRTVGIPAMFSIIPFAYCVLGALILVQGNDHRFVGIIYVSLGFAFWLAIFSLDSFWIFKGDLRQRFTDVLVNTVVLNVCFPLSTPEIAYGR